VDVTVDVGSSLLRLRVGRGERVVDPREPIGDLGDVLRADERIERARDQILRGHGPRSARRALTCTETLNRPAHRRRGLGEGRIVALAEPPLEPQHRSRELGLAGEPRRAFQRMDRTARRLERRLAGLPLDELDERVQRDQMALELEDQDPRELGIARRHDAQLSGSSSPSRRRSRGSSTGRSAATTSV